jgi:hypothetical protein
MGKGGIIESGILIVGGFLGNMKKKRQDFRQDFKMPYLFCEDFSYLLYYSSLLIN